MTTRLRNAHDGVLLQKITDTANLQAAWKHIRGNNGGPGVDAVRLADFESDLTVNLTNLQRSLWDETYLPLPLRRTGIPKDDGSIRALAIPAIVDRVAQRAFVNVLEPLFEQIFLPCSFGYRPGRSVSNAVEQILAYRAAGFEWALDGDVQDFFGSVNHTLLREQLRTYIADRAVVRIIGLWLEAGVLTTDIQEHPASLLKHASVQVCEAARLMFQNHEHALDLETDFGALPAYRITPVLQRFGTEAAHLAWEYRRTLLPLLITKSVLVGGGLAGVAFAGALAAHACSKRHTPEAIGTPQGGPISPLLANVYLHSFDVHLTQSSLRLIRYADDFVICCVSEARARHAKTVVERELRRLHLCLHPQKTQIVACQNPLHFLGYEFDEDGAFALADQARISPREQVWRAVSAVSRHSGTATQKGVVTVQRPLKKFQSDLRERWQEVWTAWHTRQDKGDI